MTVARTTLTIELPDMPGVEELDSLVALVDGIRQHDVPVRVITKYKKPDAVDRFASITSVKKNGHLKTYLNKYCAYIKDRCTCNGIDKLMELFNRSDSCYEIK